ncbi:MAG: PAS domain S-box protein, partial [Rubrobacter sp.]|nr:PAS domain S-box protein [Rubrobacter sp.]
MARDVTERKRAEERLREAEERFRSLVQNASDVILIMEAGRTVRYVSPAIEQVLGYKPEDVVGKDNFTPVYPDDLAKARNLIADAVNNPGSTSVAELRLRHADGSWRHVESRCTSLLDDPAVGGIVINSRDVTERKRFEEALRQSEERLRTIFEKSATGISIADLNRRLLETNPAYQSMLGYSGEELLGKSIAEISHPADLPEDRELHAALLAGDLDFYRREKRYVRKDGEIIWVCPTVSAVRNAEGEPQFLVGMVEDITESKEREERLREAEERYRTLVEQTPAITYIEALDGEELGHETLY